MRVTSEMKKRYISRRIEEIKLIQGQIGANDFTLAQTVGHQIKGNAKTFEFPEIAVIGVEMEAAAKERDSKNLNICLRHLSEYFDQSCGIFGQTLNK